MIRPEPSPSFWRFCQQLVFGFSILFAAACSEKDQPSTSTAGTGPSTSGGGSIQGGMGGLPGMASSGTGGTAGSSGGDALTSSASVSTITTETATGAGNTNATSDSSSTGSSDPTPGGSVTIDGPQILVGGKPLHLRGVNWNPVPKGGSHPQDLAFVEFAAQDIALMQAAGINAVRTYEPLTDSVVLDALAAAGIFVLNTVYPYGGSAADSVDAPVNATKDHPAVLLWVIGNEWNYNGLYVDLSPASSIQRIGEVAERIRALDDLHPIATVYGELPDASVLTQLAIIDVWGMNVYSGRSFGDRFTQWAALSDKPMFFGEYGADAWNATTNQYDPDSQALATRDLTNEILDNSTLGGGICSGGTIFEFADEWWKDGSGSPDTQDVGGIAPGGGPYPDFTFNEEYWGIVSIDREPRPAYEVLKELYMP